jgi:hypothetical protein
MEMKVVALLGCYTIFVVVYRYFGTAISPIFMGQAVTFGLIIP